LPSDREACCCRLSWFVVSWRNAVPVNESG
jgi:hypothetical protein